MLKPYVLDGSPPPYSEDDDLAKASLPKVDPYANPYDEDEDDYDFMDPEQYAKEEALNLRYSRVAEAAQRRLSR